jgi:hypothetical protein
MPGTKAGAAKAKQTIINRYGVDQDGKSLLHKRVGAEGGKVSVGGGFAHDGIGSDGLTGRERASIVGAKGGKAKRRKRYA